MSRLFQSTLPAGEATQRCYRRRIDRNFNPRFPRGKRRDKKEAYLDAYKFQSTPPAGEATSAAKSDDGVDYNFNPRFPRGKRLYDEGKKLELLQFQSTLPAGEATLFNFFSPSPYR